MKQRNIEKTREGDYRRIDSNDTVSTVTRDRLADRLDFVWAYWY